MPTASPPTATVHDVAAYFGITERAIYRATTQGTIPFYRVGTKLRFDLDEVREALRAPRLTKGGES